MAAYAKQFCYRLVVRIHPNSIAGIQHPIPASSFLKSLYKLSLDYDIVLIFPNEKVSAYGLISYSKAVFVDTSHVFLESLMAGHPAFITSNSATYKDLFSHRYFGFTESLENLNFNSEDILKAAMLFKHIRIDSSYKNSAPISSQEKLFHKQPSLSSMINRINADPSRLDNIDEGLISARCFFSDVELDGLQPLGSVDCSKTIFDVSKKLFKLYRSDKSINTIIQRLIGKNQINLPSHNPS